MRIMHVFRAPVGGLFRHVRELAAQQAALGHDVGLICDSTHGGRSAETALNALRDNMRLGVYRIALPRLPHPGDVSAYRAIRRILEETRPQIVHGHGAKGGLHGRLAARHDAGMRTIYTPHGGSLHFSRHSAKGALYLTTERLLLHRTDGLIFVCNFERRAFIEKVGAFSCPSAIVHNGLPAEEFSYVPVLPDAADVVFVGELRMLKGVDVLLSALARLKEKGRATSALIVGDGPDAEIFRTMAQSLNLSENVRFPGPMPARKAFAQGRMVVVPSRAESFPYVVLEAQAAGRPVIAAHVGGIPEMLPEEALVPAEDPAALAERIASVLDDPDSERKAKARIEEIRHRFSIETMTQGVLDFYDKVLLDTAGRQAA